MSCGPEKIIGNLKSPKVEALLIPWRAKFIHNTQLLPISAICTSQSSEQSHWDRSKVALTQISVSFSNNDNMGLFLKLKAFLNRNKGKHALSEHGGGCLTRWTCTSQSYSWKTRRKVMKKAFASSRSKCAFLWKYNLHKKQWPVASLQTGRTEQTKCDPSLVGWPTRQEKFLYHQKVLSSNWELHVSLWAPIRMAPRAALWRWQVSASSVQTHFLCHTLHHFLVIFSSELELCHWLQ